MEQQKYFTTSSIVSSDRVLYTPSVFARSSLLHLQEIGTLQALQAHTSSRDGLSSFLFFTVLDGAGSLVYNGQRYDLTAGDMVFIDCSRPYSHTTSDQLWTLRWCHFCGPTLPSIYEKYCERGGRPAFRPEDASAFLAVLDRLQELAGGSDYIRDMRINEELGVLLTLLMEQSWHPEEAAELPKKKASVIPVKEYLDMHYREKITLDELAARFYINKYYLTRVFKEQYGLSITAYLQAVRITQAKHMLRFTDRTVEEIGLECGIGALNYFSRVFKEVEGVAPSVYRNQW